MDSSRPNEAAPPGEVASFVRFCYHRRRAGWPELYDEMCAVAARRLYNGWGFAELADHGIGFSLFETPALASLAREVVREETERRIRTTREATIRSAVTVTSPTEEPPPNTTAVEREAVAEDNRAEAPPRPAFRLAGVTAG
jgi:hypothetical protein